MTSVAGFVDACRREIRVLPGRVKRAAHRATGVLALLLLTFQVAAANTTLVSRANASHCGGGATTADGGTEMATPGPRAMADVAAMRAGTPAQPMDCCTGGPMGLCGACTALVTMVCRTAATAYRTRATILPGAAAPPSADLVPDVPPPRR